MNKKNLLKDLLSLNKHNLKGEFLNKNSGYDGDICKILGMEEDTVRYWDAKYEGMLIEFKKGKSIWLDLVRYSEALLGTNESAKKNTFTLFFIPDNNKECIKEIIGVSTDKIINKLGLNNDIASILIRLKSNLPRTLNSQANLTVKDVREISDFII